MGIPADGAAPSAPEGGAWRLKGWTFPITRPVRLPSAGQLASGLAASAAAQIDRSALWAPVAFGAGAAAYLALKVEPPLWLAALLALAAMLVCGIAWRFSRRRALTIVTVLVALAAAGFLAAKLHSDGVAAPIAPSKGGVAAVEGWVVDIETPSERGERLLIAPVRISGLAPDATPTRIRIVIGAPGGPDSVPPPGSPVRLVTLLDPPPGPAAPSAYDFARDAWFEGIGGVGLAMRQPLMIGLPPAPARLRLEMAVNALRWRVASRLAHDIHAVLGDNDGGAAGLAVAVTTSHQDWLAASQRDDLRGSGLAHMLAIAGLHTAAVSGFAFFAFRLGVSAWPWLALRAPGKKIAALAALIVVGAYLILSGAHPPARRAAITAGVAFLAILADRRAVSLHSLAVAAFLILLMEPDVVLQPGFEMSFCATASLVALAELWPRRSEGATGDPWLLTAWRRFKGWVVAMAAVSFVAGAATGPFAIQHFNRVANYGVFANLTADFVASALLMPSLALTLLAESVGAGSAFIKPLLWVAGQSAKAIIALGHLFSSAPGAAMAYPSAPGIALAISYVGIIFACLWRGRLRWIGLPMSAAVALWPRPTPPVAWIAADGDDAAVVVAGREIPMKPGARQYAIQLWAQRRGFTPPGQTVTASNPAFDCDRRGCLPVGPTRPALAASWMHRTPDAARFGDLCARADIVILRSRTKPSSPCAAAMVLTRADFEKGGAAEVYRAPTGWRVAWAQPMRGQRPWTGSGEGVRDSGE